MQRLNWIFSRAIEKVGITGWLVMFMCLVVLGYAAIQLIPTQQKLAALELKPKPTSTQLKTVIAKEHSIPVLEQMPNASALTERLTQFFTLVEGYELAINEVSYNELHKKGEEVMRYQLTFVVDERYPTVKEFVLSALEAMPYLTLDAIAFERESVKQDNVVTKLRFTFYMVQS